MKLYSVIVFRHGTKPHPAQLASAMDVNSFGWLQRSGAREVFLFVSREVVQRCQLGSRASVSHKGHICHVQVRQDGLASAVLTDEEYPQRVAYSLVAQSLEEFMKVVPPAEWSKSQADNLFNVPSLEKLLAQYQDPKSVDKIVAIRKDIDETRDVLIKTIDQLLERGEKLENLAAKSEDLSFQSKAFLNKSEDLNKCCTIL